MSLMDGNMPLATLSAFPIRPLNTEGLHARQVFGILLGTLLSIAGTPVYSDHLPVPRALARNAGDFEQILGFPGLFRDARDGMATLSELKMPIPDAALTPLLPEPLNLSSVDRGFFNMVGIPQSNHYRDNRGNVFSVTQSAPLTQVNLQVPGSGNRLDVTQTGRGAKTALQLSGDDNRVRVLQSGPETKIEMAVRARAADLSVQQCSKAATFIFSGTIAEKGVLSVNQ